MSSGLARRSLGFGFLMALALSVPPAATAAASSAQASTAGDQAHAGKWVGTFASESGGSGNVTYVLIKDEKGWSGTVTYTSPEGARTTDLREVQITGSKFKAKIDSPDGESEITIEGEFGEKEFTGTYSVVEKSSGEIAEKGTWKTTREQTGP